MTTITPAPLFANGKWTESHGDSFKSVNPSDGSVVWEGLAATPEDVDQAVQSAKSAFTSWSQTPDETRKEFLFAFTQLVQDNKDTLAKAISLETGKPTWEALTEVQGVIGKIAISIDSYHTRCKEFMGGTALTRFKPHGVAAVYGTFNFPMHIANGHIIPALLAGNTVVLKPSEIAPLCAKEYMKLWELAGIPAGVINMVQGERPTGEALAAHPDINGIYFTGSARAGLAIQKANLNQPNKIIALEMGGNNPLIVHNTKDPTAAALLTIQSAYATAGQRCTCARRLIVPEGPEGDQFVSTLTALIAKVTVGTPDDTPPPFMGPVISEKDAQNLIKAQTAWTSRGAKQLVELKHLKYKTGLVSPGLIDVTLMKGRKDDEVFGPLLQLIRTPDIDSAITEANNTAYGLSAGIFTEDEAIYQKFFKASKAGLINWNQPLTGASSAAPFGGTGISGNHRPTAFFAADYCSYPVASVESPTLSLPEKLPPGLTL